MMRTRPAALLVLASLSLAVAAPAAHAQDPDLIGDLLRAVPTPDAQEEEEAGGGDLDLPEVVEAPSARTGPTSVPGQRVGVDDHSRTPEAPLNSAERTYEARLRAGYAAAQARLGELEGRWLVRSQAGPLYAFQFIDSGAGTLDGAWSDLRRPGALTGSGYLRSASRAGGRLVLSLEAPPRRGPVRLQLRPEAPGQWVGTLTEDGVEVAVRMQRD
ncbi:MAG: hypothetical protein IM650_07695 [Phenylobacterium sp.]|uniref:hypothetical protein n=2 Tax=Phenylobacterium sp. TaxID=1871053 RepID=UPI0025F9211D|nr:hypothetical protein [Phenylobacterium sp.]MCA6257962.1 hypothetical protein [Phenylobacterium sp.]MCA6265792.1 hypothetical protein [Phenylobacterium sp.]MCA6268966.1 hypothetical protein [Phenylobacterium sp.]MCA6279376.1 hypothetical protein [Phenylobacterium sp.]MCA6301870.1 hypothetical protein [Phenylobacterium sp.]